MNGKHGFTLAEVLITLAIIGVVAAMTIPTLIAKINEKVTENQQKVFKAKLLKGLNLTRTAGELNNTYTSTEDFLRNGLSKHLKITKICGPTEIRNCVPYDSILYTTSDNKEDSVDVKDIDTSTELNLSEDDGYRDIASFVMGDGTVVIASYKLDCLVDDGELDKDIGQNPCFAGIYDLNGSRKPNKMGKDLQTFQTASLKINKGPAVLATLNGVKIVSTATVPTPMTQADCETNKSKYGINACPCDNDYWAGAMKACKDMGGRLPTEAELAKIASELYGVTIGATESKDSVTLDESKIPTSLSGLGSSWYALWSSSEHSANEAGYRGFDSWDTGRSSTTRNDSSVRAICVGD